MSRSPHKSAVFSNRLRQARQRAGLSQEALGVEAGLELSSSSTRISRYESGIHEPPQQFAEAMAKVLGISAAFFYCADDRLAEIILLYADMPAAKRKLLADNARSLAEQQA